MSNLLIVNPDQFILQLNAMYHNRALAQRLFEIQVEMFNAAIAHCDSCLITMSESKGDFDEGSVMLRAFEYLRTTLDCIVSVPEVNLTTKGVAVIYFGNLLKQGLTFGF